MDIAGRLRWSAEHGEHERNSTVIMLREASHVIDRLRAEVERLRRAIQDHKDEQEECVGRCPGCGLELLPGDVEYTLWEALDAATDSSSVENGE